MSNTPVKTVVDTDTAPVVKVGENPSVKARIRTTQPEVKVTM